MKFVDFFAGIGGMRLGLEQAGHRCVGWCEFDKFAQKSYKAIHNTDGEWFSSDVSTVRSYDVPEADLWCFGFPCQDISVAGKQAGLESGKRSGLFFQIMRLLAGLKEEDRPKWLLVENVKNLLSIGGGFDFLRVLLELEQNGYYTEWQVLNSKDFGVPQNRERVFIVGRLGAECGREVFPISPTDGENTCKLKERTVGQPQGNRVYDVDGLSCTLSSNGGGAGAKTGLYAVPPQNVLPMIVSKPFGEGGCGRMSIKKATETASCLTAREYKGLANGSTCVCAVATPARAIKTQHGRRIKEAEEPMFTITTQDVHGIAIKEATKKGYTIAEDGDSVNFGMPGSATRRGRVGRQIANTLTCANEIGVVDGIRIRRLTPRECWRLQGFPDEYFERAKAAGISDTQLYKQAGNAVTVNVAYAIGLKLKEVSEDEKA